MPLAWTKQSNTVWSARTDTGTCIVHDKGDYAILDVWRNDQSNIGRGKFDTVALAQARATVLLDPRWTSWEMLDQLDLNEPPE